MKKLIYITLITLFPISYLNGSENNIIPKKEKVYGISCKKIKNKSKLKADLKKYKDSFIADDKLCIKIKKSDLSKYVTKISPK